MDFQNIGSTFSSKSDLILSEILEKYNLGEPGDISELVLTKLTMLFSRGEILEKELIETIQKEVNVSQKTAAEIAKEIINNLIPTLWDKMSEKDKSALLGEKTENQEENPLPVVKKPEFINVEQNAEAENKNKMQKNINKPIEISEKEKSKLPKKPITSQAPKPSGPDNYREPIE